LFQIHIELDRAAAEGENYVKQNFPESTIIQMCPVFGYEDRLLNVIGNLGKSNVKI